LSYELTFLDKVAECVDFGEEVDVIYRTLPKHLIRFHTKDCVARQIRKLRDFWQIILLDIGMVCMQIERDLGITIISHERLEIMTLWDL